MPHEPRCDADDSGAGAAAALFSPDPLLVEARKRIDQGNFAAARELLRKAPSGLTERAGELLEIMDRIEVAYQTTAPELLAKLKPSIPDVSLTDLERWSSQNELQFRTIDSVRRYFNREPANVFRFCDEAKSRRLSVPPKPAHDLVGHLRQIIEASQQSPDAMFVPVDHVVRYEVTIKPDAPGLRRGETIRAWLPFPQELDYQRNVRLIEASPTVHQLSPPDSPHRTIYFQTVAGEESPTFSVAFSFTSFARYLRLNEDESRPLSSSFAAFTRERPPHICFTAALLSAAREAVGTESNPLARVRRIYDYVVRTIAYASEEEYCTIANLSEKTLLTRRGDCGAMAMLFITLCRASGIPARWESGFQTRPGMEDMHDWAEFYVEPFGWLPADLSYGYQRAAQSSDPEIYDFYFGHLDSYRLVVNRNFGAQLLPHKSLLRSEPLDFQRGEIELANRNLFYPHWSWSVQIDTKISER